VQIPPYQRGQGDVPQRAEALCCITYVHYNGTDERAIHELPLQDVKTQNFASLQCKFPLIKGGRGMSQFPLIKGGRGMSRRGLKPSVE